MITYKIHKAAEESTERVNELLALGYVPFAVCREDRTAYIYFREQCGFATYEEERKFNASELKRKQNICVHDFVSASAAVMNSDGNYERYIECRLCKLTEKQAVYAR